ncbi:hypothetical protein TNCT_118871 [Trichonephila clavata]|uniref:Uncharacterized protein n=2 Tax=Trichonephila clavata TaxID=2740835 RepID=A0A8X6LRG5_TRICU|nr:hypothetical protein TNCT_118871 [Trichonephila clavata]
MNDFLKMSYATIWFPLLEMDDLLLAFKSLMDGLIESILEEVSRHLIAVKIVVLVGLKGRRWLKLLPDVSLARVASFFYGVSISKVGCRLDGIEAPQKKLANVPTEREEAISTNDGL